VASVKLAEVLRGKVVESVHYGSIVVVDHHGEIITALGDPHYFTYFRSAAKPLQALAVLEGGAADYYDFSLKDIALFCGSHTGEKEHQSGVQNILEKIDLDASFLKCDLANPCSGKHAGMLALAKYWDLSLADYYLPTHLVQQEMKGLVADFAGLKPEELKEGIDGCGVPVWALPLRNMARAYAQLVNLEVSAGQLVQKAMQSQPFYVGGSKSFDTALLSALSEKIIAKFGAEGVYCLGVPERRWGIALKIADGNVRALPVVVLSVLKQLALLDNAAQVKMVDWLEPKLKNSCGEIVGLIRPVFKLLKGWSKGV
jgi:L-asparaginase II